MNDKAKDVLSEENLQQWVTGQESSKDSLNSTPANALAATLNREEFSFSDGDTLPPLWHWLFFNKISSLSQVARDGHPKKGEFLPPIPLPRRMWAGSRLEFLRPLTIGSTIYKESTIKSISFKNGRSGQLAFVGVEHALIDAEGVAIREEQDIVYRDNPKAGTSAPKPSLAEKESDYSFAVNPDPVLLFRYSALTFNSHRIHYDRDYAKNVEGYPGLIVHGPLLATFLVELIAKQYPERAISKFEFRAMSPVFEGVDDKGFEVCGLVPDDDSRCELWIQNGFGELCMKGSVLLEK